MNKNDVKYMFLCILMIILILFLIYSIFNIFFSNGYVISVTNKNRQEINEMLEKIRVQEKITRLELDKILGNAELRIYNHFKLCDTKKVSESSDIFVYILEEGSSIRIKYIFYALASIILIAINKELIDRLNNKEICS